MSTSRDDSREPHDVSTQVAELARQVEETRKQMIKTANIVGNLSAEIKAVGRQHHLEQRRLTFNSIAAYVIFVVLIASGFYFVFRSQAERMELEKETLVREHAAGRTKLQSLQKSIEDRREAEAKAASFYRLSQSGQIHRALKMYPEIAQLPLSRVESAMFQRWVNRVRNRLAYSAYSNGMKAVGAKHWKRATNEFRRALEYLPHPPHEASLRYYFGISRMKLGSYKAAAAELERALKADAEKSVSNEVRFYLGNIYEQVGRRDRAISAYKSYIKRFPGTNFARAARRRIKALK